LLNEISRSRQAKVEITAAETDWLLWVGSEKKHSFCRPPYY